MTRTILIIQTKMQSTQNLLNTRQVLQGVLTMERKVTTNTRRDTSPTNATFQITDRKLYVPVVSLSTENDKNPLGTIKNRI